MSFGTAGRQINNSSLKKHLRPDKQSVRIEQRGASLSGHTEQSR